MGSKYVSCNILTRGAAWCIHDRRYSSKRPRLLRHQQILQLLYFHSGRYTDSLLAGRSGDRIPMGARSLAPIQTDPASYKMGTGSVPGVKRPGRGVDHPPQSSVEVKERIELYIYSTSGPLWPVKGLTLPLPFTVFPHFWNILYTYTKEFEFNSIMTCLSEFISSL